MLLENMSVAAARIIYLAAVSRRGGGTTMYAQQPFNDYNVSPFSCVFKRFLGVLFF